MDETSVAMIEETGHVNEPKRDTLECTICSKPYTYEKHLLNHMILKHASPNSDECHLCGETCDNRPSLRRHLKSHLNSKKFQCDFCSASFAVPFFLKQHKLLHSDIEKVGCKCPVCNKTFLRKDNLLNHMKTHYPEEQERIPCNICGKHIKKVSYDKHKYNHSRSNRYPCLICQKLFPSQSVLNLHLNIHTGDTQYKCDLCDFITCRKDSLSMHTSRHRSKLAPKTHKCSLCQKVYKSKDTLARHIKLHKNRKPYNCKKCDRSFTSAWWCKVHEEEHTVTKKNHHCDKCQKSFVSAQRLNLHMRIHSKPYVCGICSHSFVNRGDLTRHIKVHQNETIKVHQNESVKEHHNETVFQLCGRTVPHLTNHMIKRKQQTVYKCEECKCIYLNLKTYKDACQHIQEKLPRCQLCKKIFLTESGLNIHVKKFENSDVKCYNDTRPKTKATKKTNTPKPQNKCQECNKEFSDMHSYRQHMESHDPDKQFCCEYCHERFYSFTKLYKHMGKHNG